MNSGLMISLEITQLFTSLSNHLEKQNICKQFTRIFMRVVEACIWLLHLNSDLYSLFLHHIEREWTRLTKFSRNLLSTESLGVFCYLNWIFQLIWDSHSNHLEVCSKHSKIFSRINQLNSLFELKSSQWIFCYLPSLNNEVYCWLCSPVGDFFM